MDKKALSIQFWKFIAGRKLLEAKALYMEHGPNINVNWTNPSWNLHTPLYAACYQGYGDVVAWLVDTTPVDLNFKTYAGDTCLNTIIFWNYERLVPLALEKGANPRLRDYDSKTALQMAGECGYRPIAKHLLMYEVFTETWSSFSLSA